MSQSTSSTPSVEIGFPAADLAMARMYVREMVASGKTKANDLLVLPPSAMAAWIEEEAIAFLRRNKAERQKVVAEIK